MGRLKQATGSIREECIDCGQQPEDSGALRCYACTTILLQRPKAPSEAAAKTMPAEPAAMREPFLVTGPEEGRIRKAMDRTVPLSTSPHQSVQMRCTEVRRAFRKGWIACLESLKEQGK